MVTGSRCAAAASRSVSALVHAALRPDWLLSDLALDHTCPSCNTMAALALLRQDKGGMPVTHWCLNIVGSFDED